MASTLDSYAPFDDGDGANVTEDTWRSFMRRHVTSGVARTVLNQMEIFADSTGMQVKARTGEVLVEGHWGQNASEKTLSIAAADPTDPRLDLVVARAHFVNNIVELDVVTGTPASSPSTPSFTRNTTQWEVPLAVVSVSAGASTIAAGDVDDARVFGGALGTNTVDDLILYGDKYSTMRRLDIATDNTGQNDGEIFINRVQANISHDISKFRLAVGDTAQSGGTFEVAVYTGHRQEELDRIASTTISLSSTKQIAEATFSSVNIEAGLIVVAAYLQLSASTVPTLGKSAIFTTSDYVNPSNTSNLVSAKKSGFGSMPSTLDILDGTWTARDAITWVGLA